jgi:hypothetical protein
METPLLGRIIYSIRKAAGNAIRAPKGPFILGAAGLLLVTAWGLAVFAYYYSVNGSFPPPNFFDIGGGLVLNGLMPQYFPPVSPHLIASMTPEQIYLSRLSFIGMALGSFLIFVASIWRAYRLVNAAERKAKQLWR